MATDPAGNTGPPATWDWTVDTVAPTATITDAPVDPTNDPDATFTFSSPDATATFTCTLDAGTPTACTSPSTATGLADGPHTFSVVATDPAGNTSTPATHTWVVDTVDPTLTLTSAPPDPTTATDASFTWTVDDPDPEPAPEAPLADAVDRPATDVVLPDATTCALDGGPAEPCTSGVTYTGLTLGAHTWTVTVTDAVGNATSATHTWSVVAPPTTTTTTATTAAPSATAPTSTAPTAATTGDLPRTGDDAGRALTLAAVLLAAGLALVAGTRRRTARIRR